MSSEIKEAIDTVRHDMRCLTVDDMLDGALQVHRVNLLCCIAESLNQISETLETVSNSLEYLSENARKEIDL